MIIKGVKIEYGIVDKTLATDTIDSETSSTSSFSNEETLQNTDKQKLAYLEKDYFLLNGSYILPEEGKTYNTGWESSSISDASGNIAEYIEYLFGSHHASYGIRLKFPEDSVAQDFTISYYNDDLLLGSIEAVGNQLPEYSDTEYFLDWNRVRITFHKVNPQQRARFYWVSFGITTSFDENTIMSISCSKSTDLSADYAETGAVSFEVFNDGVFKLKDIKDLPIGLQEGQRIVVYTKQDSESTYRVFGEYLSETTGSSEKGKLVQITGYDALYQLGNTIFKKGIVYPQGRSLADWAQEVADDAGISVSIATKLNSIMSKGYITEVPHREALRLIAEAGCCILRVNSDGVICFEEAALNEKGALTSDELVEDSHQIESDKLLGVEVVEYSYFLASSEQELGYLEEVVLLEEEQELEIVYSAYPVDISTVQIFVKGGSSAQITSQQIYSDRLVLKLKGTTGDTTFVTVTGKPYNVVSLSATAGSITKNIKKVENNFLITSDLVQDVVDYQYRHVVNVYQHSAEVLTDKSLSIGDSVVFEDEKIAVESIEISVSPEDTSVTISGSEVV